MARTSPSLKTAASSKPLKNGLSTLPAFPYFPSRLMHRPVPNPEYRPGTGYNQKAAQRTVTQQYRNPKGMNYNLRTAALIAAGIVSAGSVIAEEGKSNPVETALSATTISGYVSASAMFDLQGVKGGTALPGRVFDTANEVDQISLDVVKLTVEKPLDDSDWSAGYKFDLLFGPDANGLGTSSVFGNNANSDFAIKQAYVNLHAPVGNGLTAKVGVFDTLIGYEVYEHGNNPNYSRSYAYFIEPFQHTGIILSYQLTDAVAINAGVANAWNSRINAAGAEPASTKDFGIQTYLASISLTAPESFGALKGATLYAGVVHGLSGNNPTVGAIPVAANDGAMDGDPRTSLYAGATVPLPITDLAIGAAWDYRMSERYRGAGIDNADEYATTIAGYLTYEFTKTLKANLRGEYATGSAGTWAAKPVGGPDKEEFLGLTGSLDIGLWANVITRLEVRWDQDLGEGGAVFGNATNPKDQAITGTVNVVYKF